MHFCELKYTMLPIFLTNTSGMLVYFVSLLHNFKYDLVFETKHVSR